MDQYLGKKYKLKSSDKFDDFLKFLGIGLLQRKTATSLSPVCELTRADDGTYTYSFTSPVKSLKYVFKEGEETVTERADGAKMMSTFTFEGDDFIQIEVHDNGKRSRHVRTFTEDKIVVISTIEGWDDKAVRVYERVN
ncbi:fatty acid-binding protein-like [Galleria mellonella]|uniref:Fatty acid-binding protein-like n=1 Tax=Galleria mellonella TaxID=7137 RepID=A0ABM3ML22_GALME|nr:fatty acid-binding protein-like [Galleria mellonella]